MWGYIWRRLGSPNYGIEEKTPYLTRMAEGFGGLV